MDLLLPPRQHVLRRDVANGAVQTNIVVMLDVADIFNHSNLYLVYGENEVTSFVGTVANSSLPAITATRGLNLSSTATGNNVNNGRLENRNLQLALRLSF